MKPESSPEPSTKSPAATATGRPLRAARRAARQSAIAALGQEALAGTAPAELIEETVCLLRDVFRVELAVVLELVEDAAVLEPRAAAGSLAGGVAPVQLAAPEASPYRFTLEHPAPVLVTDLRNETRFAVPAVMLEHGMLSAMSVVIRSRRRPYGVLAVVSNRSRWFDVEDADALTAAANVLGLAIERARADAQMRASEARSRFLASIVEQSDDAIITGGLDDVILTWNPGAERLFGYTAAEALGRKARDLYLRELPESEYQRVLARIRGARPVRFESRCTTRTGTAVFVFATAAPMYDHSGKHIGEILVARDVTELRAAREALLRLNTDLEQRVAERTMQLEAAYREAEALSYSIAHDLRAPLRAISGYARILEEELAPILPEQAQNYLQRMGSNAVRLGTLIDALLSLQSLSRQPLARTTARLNEAVEDALGWLRSEQPGRDIELTEDDLGEAQADPALIRLAFANLLSNALKFTRGRHPAQVHVGRVRRDEGWVYFVRDNGVGFDMRYADKLFGVFQRLHRESEYEGSGIGLASVHRIVQRHRGRIWAEGEVGRGATFYFTLGPEVGADTAMNDFRPDSPRSP